MTPRRNDPCPCGSGRKYKDCCLQGDRRAQRSAVPTKGLPSDAQVPDVWAANLSPMPARITTAPNSRLAMVLVEAGGFILHGEVSEAPAPTVDAVAAILADAVGAAADQAGFWPATITVRHDALVAPLTALLAERQVAVVAQVSLPDLDAALVALHENMDLTPIVHLPALPHTWAGWGLPEAMIAELFQAAAAYYRAAPWRWVANIQPLAAHMPDGTRWTLCVLGNGGHEFGLALYGAASDLQRLVDTQVAAMGSVVDGPVLSVTFDPRNDLPKEMQREVTAHHWEVAGREAWPVLMAQNTIWAGISPAQAADLIACLRAVPGFVAAHHAVFTGDSPSAGEVSAVDPTTGVRLSYTGLMLPAGPAYWSPPAVLTACTATGAGAEPAAALEPGSAESLAAEAEGQLERFRGWLPTAKVGRGKQAALEIAELFAVSFLASYQGIPVRAITELDLRLFLYEWYPRKVYDDWRHARQVPGRLALFFQFLADTADIQCPWAAAVLADTEAYTERWESCPGHLWWDEGMAEWRAEAYLDLERRAMVHDADLGEDDIWGSEFGPDEARLDHLLGRQWLLWRDELIHAGATNPSALLMTLSRRQRRWEEEPRPEYGGRTAIRVIRDERRARPHRGI